MALKPKDETEPTRAPAPETAGGPPPAQTTNVPATQKTALPADALDYGEIADDGMDDVKPEDQLIPMLRILQKNSPQCEADSDKFIKEAQAGMLLNTATSELFSGDEADGVRFVIAHYHRAYAEYTPRDQGGGFLGLRPIDDEQAAELRKAQGRFGKLETDVGTELVETYYAYVLMLPEEPGGDPAPMIVAFSSTGITPFKQLAGLLNGLRRKRVPLYAPIIHASTRRKQNAKGTFFTWFLRFAGTSADEYLLKPGDPILDTARAFRAQIEAGEVKADYADAEAAGGATAEGDDIPF